MKRFVKWSSVILICSMVVSCSSNKKTADVKSDRNVTVPGPKAIIYQTKKDYSKLVPVNLSADKKSIESYPGIGDVYFEDKLAYPTQLHDDFWLDNRGINAYSAFINLTYEEYSKLQETPNQEELMKMITDSDPVVVMYTCGLRSSYRDIVKELNSKIDAGDFSAFTKIK